MGPRDGVSSVTETGEKTVSQLLMQRAVETDTGKRQTNIFHFLKGVLNKFQVTIFLQSYEYMPNLHLLTELRVHAQFTFV